jgi:hypothetical protein
MSSAFLPSLLCLYAASEGKKSGNREKVATEGAGRADDLLKGWG